MTPSDIISPLLAEITMQSPEFTLAEVATMLTICGGVGAGVVWFFGTKFVTRDVYEQERKAARESYEQDRKEVMNQLRACNEALLLTAQTHKELKAVMETLSSNVKENTSVTHSLDKRLAVLEALSKDN